MIELLESREMSARELSEYLGLKEREVHDHLPSIARTLSARKSKLVVMPCRCLACGYVFKDRTRYTKPGRCPSCKKSQITDPTYRIE